MKNCYFYSRFNCAGSAKIKCDLKGYDVDRDICSVCPYYINYITAENLIKRYVIERGKMNKDG